MLMRAFLLLQAVLLVLAAAPDKKYIRAVNNYADGIRTTKFMCGLGRDALPGIIKSGARRMMKWSPPLRGTMLKTQLEESLRSRRLLDHDAMYTVNDVCAESYLLLWANDIKRIPKKTTKREIATWVREQMAGIGELDADIIEHFIEKAQTYHHLVHNASPHEYGPSSQLRSGAGPGGASSSRIYGGGGGFGCFG